MPHLLHGTGFSNLQTGDSAHYHRILSLSNEHIACILPSVICFISYNSFIFLLHSKTWQSPAYFFSLFSCWGHRHLLSGLPACSDFAPLIHAIKATASERFKGVLSLFGFSFWMSSFAMRSPYFLSELTWKACLESAPVYLFSFLFHHSLLHSVFWTRQTSFSPSCAMLTQFWGVPT